MAINNNLNFNFDPADDAAIHSALDTILALLNVDTVAYVNLTAKERKDENSIGPERMPFAQDGVRNIIPNFPPLASPSIGITRTTTLLDLVDGIAGYKPKLDEIVDRMTDMGLNAEEPPA